jgi:hypothetical protein
MEVSNRTAALKHFVERLRLQSPANHSIDNQMPRPSCHVTYLPQFGE